MSRKLDKQFYLKKLYEQQIVRTDPSKSPSQRNDQAAQLMDELVGPRWREEVNWETELVPDLPTLPNMQEQEEFWGRVQQAGYAAGFGTENVEHDEPQDSPEPHCKAEVPKLLLRIRELLGL